MSTAVVVRLFNPLNTHLNPICHLLALLGAHHIFHVSGLRVNKSKENWWNCFGVLFWRRQGKNSILFFI